MADGGSVKRRVAYYYRGDMGHFYFGPGYPMKPHRVKLTHHLLVTYGLNRKMDIYRPHMASREEIAGFHSDSYVDFLRRVTPDTSRDFAAQLTKFNVGEATDCPVFDGLYEYCQMYAGASIDGAVRLNRGDADICVNWSGGLHHAKKGEASGFCFVNDIVLSILELLKYHHRVLYIDIDIHHGDGVEEAFYTTDRVMTVSFHKYGNFFPGTGDIKDVGVGDGKHHSINFPLRDGMDDLSYESIFKPVIAKVMESYRPSAIVLQCGADSIAGDRLGCFNLSLKGHAECVKFVKSFGVPTLVLGGGGYTIRNVARCWAYETAVLLDTPVADTIPPNDFIEFYKPDYRLHIPTNSVQNLNSREYLEACKVAILENLRSLEPAPGAPFQDVPRDWTDFDDPLEDEADPDQREVEVEGGAAKRSDAEHFAGDDDQDQNEHDAEAEAAAAAAPSSKRQRVEQEPEQAAPEAAADRPASGDVAMEVAADAAGDVAEAPAPAAAVEAAAAPASGPPASTPAAAPPAAASTTPVEAGVTAAAGADAPAAAAPAPAADAVVGQAAEKSAADGDEEMGAEPPQATGQAAPAAGAGDS